MINIPKRKKKEKQNIEILYYDMRKKYLHMYEAEVS